MDDATFRQVADDHTAPLLRLAHHLTHSDPAAEDLLQETLLRAFRARDGFRGESSPITWLRRIMHNVAIDRARAQKDELPLEVVETLWRDDHYTVDPERVAERTESIRELREALTRLPFIYRTTLLLHDVEGWTVREIADAMSVEVSAAKQRLRRGRMMLVTALATAPDRRRALKGVPMSCWDARSLVSDFLDGALDSAQREIVERHLATCPTCPPLYASLLSTREALGGMRDPDTVVPPTVADRIRHLTRANDPSY